MRLHKMALCGLQARESLIMGGSFCMRKTQNRRYSAQASRQHPTSYKIRPYFPCGGVVSRYPCIYINKQAKARYRRFQAVIFTLIRVCPAQMGFNCGISAHLTSSPIVIWLRLVKGNKIALSVCDYSVSRQQKKQVACLLLILRVMCRFVGQVLPLSLSDREGFPLVRAYTGKCRSRW